MDAINDLCNWDTEVVVDPKFEINRTESIHQTLWNIHPPLRIYMSKGMVPMNLSFHRVFAEQGICYTYNVFNSRDIYTDM